MPPSGGRAQFPFSAFPRLRRGLRYCALCEGSNTEITLWTDSCRRETAPFHRLEKGRRWLGVLADANPGWRPGGATLGQNALPPWGRRRPLGLPRRKPGNGSPTQVRHHKKRSVRLDSRGPESMVFAVENLAA